MQKVCKVNKGLNYPWMGSMHENFYQTHHKCRQFVSRLMALLQKGCQLLFSRGIPMGCRMGACDIFPWFSLVTHSKDRIFQRLPPRECFHSRRYFCNSQLSEFSRILSQNENSCKTNFLFSRPSSQDRSPQWHVALPFLFSSKWKQTGT